MTIDDTATDLGVALPSVEPPDLRRLHPLTPILRSWRLIGGAGAIGFGVFRDEVDRLLWVWHALQGDVELSVVMKAAAVLLVVAVGSLTAAWLSWRVTGFAIVADGNGRSTLLLHRGLFVKLRRQVRLNRVQSVDVNQPLVPRLCGLAALQLDMAAGEEASVDLAYLRASDAWLLRKEILRHTGADTVAHSVTSGHGPADSLVAQVSTAHLVKANLLDGVGAWVLLGLWVVALVVATSRWGLTAFFTALSGIVPVTIVLLAALRKQITSMMRDADFRLYRTATGIRVSSGLTSTINKTIELDRIQGVRLIEPYLWRRFGWARVMVDIAGGKEDGEEGASLMPVTARADALRLIAEVTGAQLDAAAFVGAGIGARRVDPLGWRYLGVAILDPGVVRRHGRWRRSTSYVPFARVQSVTAQQGPLQRWLNLASVHLDLPVGATRWSAQHRGTDDAAVLVHHLGQLARQHRLTELAGPPENVTES